MRAVYIHIRFDYLLTIENLYLSFEKFIPAENKLRPSRVIMNDLQRVNQDM